MAPSKTLLLRATLALLALVVCWTAIAPVDGKKKSKSSMSLLTGDEKLATIASQLKDGVFEFTSASYEQLAVRPDRPFHLVVLYTATADKFGCEVCKTVHPEFYALAQSYAAAKQSKIDTRDGLEVVFGLVDFDANQEVFGLYGFTSAPNIAYVGPDRNTDEGKSMPSKQEIPPHNMYNLYQQGKKAEDINGFVKTKTGFDFEIQRSKAVLYATLATLVVLLLVLAKIVLSNLDIVLAKLRRKRLWMTVSLLFYGLSVSGMVYCIIREPAAYQTDRNGDIKFFHPQGRSQFVVEGLIVGGYDVAAAIAMILLSQWAIYLHNPAMRYTAIVACLFGFVFMYQQMISAYKFKNRWYTGWMGF